MARKLLTISIEGMSLKLLACQGQKVLAWSITAVNPVFLKGGFVADSARLAGVIKTAVNKKGFGGQHRVLASLPAFHSVCRPVELPGLRAARPEVVIPQHARREMGYSAENNLLFWQPLASQGGDQRRFLVLSVPKEPVVTLFQTLRQAGLRPHKIETSTFAFARAVNRSEAVIAAVELNSLHVIVLRDSLPLTTRSTFLGEEPRDIQSLPSLVSDALDGIISFYNESNPANPLPPDIPLFLFGSALSMNPDIAPAVAAALGRSVSEFALPLLLRKRGRRFHQPPDFPKADLACNIGLVLGEL